MTTTKPPYKKTIHSLAGNFELSIPDDASRTIEVIGAGASRTGTMSIALALEILLDGPVMHGGTQVALREDCQSVISQLRANVDLDSIRSDGTQVPHQPQRQADNDEAPQHHHDRLRWNH